MKEFLAKATELFPNKRAILFNEKEITFKELDDASNRVAHGLLNIGIKKGDRVLLSLYTGPEYLIYFFACMKASAIVVPMNPSYKSGDAKGILFDAEPKASFLSARTYENLRPVVRGSGIEHVFVEGRQPKDDALCPEIFFAGFPTTPPDAAPIRVEDDVAFLPYTSGTTGRPKGAMLTHGNLSACLQQYIAAGRVSERDISLIFVPATHVYGTTLMAGAVAACATQILMERYTLQTMLELIEKHRVTLCYGTTSVLVEMSNSPIIKKFDLSSIRYMNSGGAPLPKEISDRVAKMAGIKIANGYGMTEAPISGTRVPGEERRIADLETGETWLKPGELGEVAIRGPQVMKGYWRDPEATARVLRDGWFYTGDIGTLDEKGNLQIMGRKKEMIKYKGFAIPPSELEGILLEHPAVGDCAVIGIPQTDVGEVPKAFIVTKPGAFIGKEDLIRFAAERVAGYKKIQELVFVDSLPRNSQGKILKRLLK